MKKNKIFALFFVFSLLFSCGANTNESDNSSIDETINQVNEEISLLSRDLINKINETIETTNDLQNEYEEKSFELDLSYNSIQNTKERHGVSVKELKKEIALLKSEHKIKKAELERKYTSIRNKIEELESSGVYYEDEEYSSLVEKLFKVENEIKESDKNLKESVNAIESEIATLNKSYSDSMNKLKESRTLTISEIEAISTQLSGLNDELINQIKSVNEEIKNLTSNLTFETDLVGEEIENLNALLNTLNSLVNKNIETIADIETKLNVVRDNVCFCESHSYGAPTIESIETCTTIGCRYRVCHQCGMCEYEFVEAKGHVVTSWTKVFQDCQESLYYGKCDTCGEAVFCFDLESDPDTEETYYKNIVESTCVTHGYVEYFCPECDRFIKKEELELDPDNHEKDDYSCCMITIAEWLAKKDSVKPSVIKGVVTAVNKIDKLGSFAITDETGTAFAYERPDKIVKLGDEIIVFAAYAENEGFPELKAPQILNYLNTNQLEKVEQYIETIDIKTLEDNFQSYYENKESLCTKYLKITGGYLILDSSSNGSLSSIQNAEKGLISLYYHTKSEYTKYKGYQVDVICAVRHIKSTFISVQVQSIVIVNNS